MTEKKSSLKENIAMQLVVFGAMLVVGSSILSAVSGSLSNTNIVNATKEIIQKQKEMSESSHIIFYGMPLGLVIFLIGVVIIIYPTEKMNKINKDRK